MKVLIIIPVFNEALNIGELLNKIILLNYNYDVLVINDASEDNSAQICRNMCFKVVNLPVNLGIGGAMQTGYIYAYNHDYDIAVQLDGDGQHDPIYIDRVLKPILIGDADMVIGSRFIEKDGFQSTFLRRLGIRFFRYLIYFFTKHKITDPTSGFRACNRKVICQFARYYPYDYPEPETLVTVCRRGFKLKEVPVVMQERQGGSSSIQALRTVYYMIKVTLAIIVEILRKPENERYITDGNSASSFSDYC